MIYAVRLQYMLEFVIMYMCSLYGSSDTQQYDKLANMLHVHVLEKTDQHF